MTTVHRILSRNREHRLLSEQTNPFGGRYPQCIFFHPESTHSSNFTDKVEVAAILTATTALIAEFLCEVPRTAGQDKVTGGRGGSDKTGNKTDTQTSVEDCGKIKGDLIYTTQK